MYAELSISEAERMLAKINKIGRHHQNAKFLANEALSDLRTAERNLSSVEDEQLASFKDRIASVRKSIKELDIT